MGRAMKIPNVSELPAIDTKFADPNKELIVYKRDPETLARTQAIPGQAGLNIGLELGEIRRRWYCYDLKTTRKCPNYGQKR